MSWAKLDDSFHDHPKVLATPLAALGLYVTALGYCARHLTDGVLTLYAVTQLSRGDVTLPAALVAAGLWDGPDAAGCYRVHDYLDHNLSAKDAKLLRKATRERVRKYRERMRAVTPYERVSNTFVPDGTGSISSREKRGAGEKRGLAAYSTPFLRFWESYPPRDGRRDKKAEAFAEWKKLAPDAALQATLIAAALRYRVEKPVDACRFLKHRRWEDEAEVKPARPAAVPARNPELERIAAKERELGMRRA